MTTSAVIARNIVKDQVLRRLGLPAGREPDLVPSVFADGTNNLNLVNWRYRLPSYLPVVGGFMHPVLQLPHLLDHWAEGLDKEFQLSFSHTLTSHNNPDDLINNLRNDRVTLVHGVWENISWIQPPGRFNSTSPRSWEGRRTPCRW